MSLVLEPGKPCKLNCLGIKGRTTCVGGATVKIITSVEKRKKVLILFDLRKEVEEALF